MKERPILFSGEMVKAILDGRKTMTRRVIKPQPSIRTSVCIDANSPSGYSYSNDVYGDIYCKCPYGKVGDRLWVREAFVCFDEETPENTGEIFYKADDNGPLNFKWKSPYYMKKQYAHIWLEITNIRVERLQEITEEDAKVEGVKPNICDSARYVNGKWIVDEKDHCPAAGTMGCPENCLLDWTNYLGGDDDEPAYSAKESFQTLWDSINAKRGFGWESNPWVWVVEFKRTTQC